MFQSDNDEREAWGPFRPALRRAAERTWARAPRAYREKVEELTLEGSWEAIPLFPDHYLLPHSTWAPGHLWIGPGVTPLHELLLLSESAWLASLAEVSSGDPLVGVTGFKLPDGTATTLRGWHSAPELLEIELVEESLHPHARELLRRYTGERRQFGGEVSEEVRDLYRGFLSELEPTVGVLLELHYADTYDPTAREPSLRIPQDFDSRDWPGWLAVRALAEGVEHSLHDAVVSTDSLWEAALRAFGGSLSDTDDPADQDSWFVMQAHENRREQRVVASLLRPRYEFFSETAATLRTGDTLESLGYAIGARILKALSEYEEAPPLGLLEAGARHCFKVDRQVGHLATMGPLAEVLSIAMAVRLLTMHEWDFHGGEQSGEPPQLHALRSMRLPNLTIDDLSDVQEFAMVAAASYVLDEPKDSLKRSSERLPESLGQFIDELPEDSLPGSSTMDAASPRIVDDIRDLLRSRDADGEARTGRDRLTGHGADGGGRLWDTFLDREVQRAFGYGSPSDPDPVGRASACAFRSRVVERLVKAVLPQLRERTGGPPERRSPDIGRLADVLQRGVSDNDIEKALLARSDELWGSARSKVGLALRDFAKARNHYQHGEPYVEEEPTWFLLPEVRPALEAVNIYDVVKYMTIAFSRSQS